MIDGKACSREEVFAVQASGTAAEITGEIAMIYGGIFEDLKRYNRQEAALMRAVLLQIIEESDPYDIGEVAG